MEPSTILQNLQSSIRALDDSTKKISSALLRIKRFEETDALKLEKKRQEIMQRSAKRIEKMDIETLRLISDITR